MGAGRKGKFILESLRHPLQTGAIAPSSAALARTITDWIEWDNVQTVIEYGPGAGAFTGHILERLRPGARYVGIERNQSFVAALAGRFPDATVYLDSVKNVKTILSREGIEQIDAVVCGLPWAVFTNQAQDEYLRTMIEVMRPRAQFATFAYLQGLLIPAGHRFKRRLHENFSRVTRSKTVWWNLPPAFVYRCRK